MPVSEKHLQHLTEPLPDGVRFILPRRPNSAGGGFCAILFGMIFSGFALFWMLGASGLLDPLADSLMGDTGRPPPANVPGEFEEDDEPAEPETPPKMKRPGPEPAGAIEPEPTGPEPAAKPATKPGVDPALLEHYTKKVAAEQKKNPSGGLDISRWFFALFGLPFFIVGLMPISMGLMLIFGHTEVDVTAEELVVTEKVGFLRRRKHRALSGLIRLDVGKDVTRAESDPSRPKPVPTQSFGIYAHFRNETPLAIAVGYPTTMLKPLAQDLAREHQRRVGGPAIEVSDTSHHGTAHPAESQPFVPEIVPPQPAGSDAQLERVASGITLRVPPVGFRKTTMPLILFAAFWLAFVSLFTCVMFIADVPLEMYLFISIFWAVGILVLLLGLNMARKQAVFDVVHDTLLVTKKGLFGQSAHEWRVDDLLDIRVDFSGTSVNKRQLMNLQIVPREGKMVGLFTGRETEELQWMAAELRRALGMRRRE